MSEKIPFNKPYMAGKELYYIAQSVLSGHTSGDGEFSKKCQTLFEQTFQAKKTLLTTSCTSALEMTALLCDLQPGDEVIVPSYTFVSTVNAFILRDVKPVFVDIRPDTKNIDEKLIEQAITHKTKAIVPVHYAGVSCEMDEINSIAKKNNLYVIEDAAQGVNAKYKNQYLGTLGDLGTYSFHETKNFICGEGGALVINKDQFIKRAEILREKGTNRSQFFRGQVDKYTWVDVGSSYVPSDLLAAFLYGQLEKMNEINVKREKIYQSYYNALKPLADKGLIELPFIPEHCESNYHMFYILLKDHKQRTDLIQFLKADNIQAVFHYIPLHSSPMGESLGYEKGLLPVTESISDCLLRLPFYYELTELDIERISQRVSEYFN